MVAGGAVVGVIFGLLLGGFVLGHLVSHIAWMVLQATIIPVTPTAPSSSSWLFMMMGAVWTAIATLIIAAFQARRLKRLAPGWMKRLHDAVRKEAGDRT